MYAYMIPGIYIYIPGTIYASSHSALSLMITLYSVLFLTFVKHKQSWPA